MAEHVERVAVEPTPDGVRLLSRDGKYERWFTVPWEHLDPLIVDLMQAQWAHDVTE